MSKQEAIAAVKKAKKVYVNVFFNEDSNEYFRVSKEQLLDTLETLFETETVKIQDNGDTVIVG